MSTVDRCRTVNDFYMGLKDEICFPQVGWDLLLLLTCLCPLAAAAALC